MAELENAQQPAPETAEQTSSEEKPPEKPSDKSAENQTTFDIKFTLTKKKKILIAASAILVLVIVALATIWFTDLKYSVFGLFFKAEAQVVVADSKTLQPIEGAEVRIDDKTAKTDKGGRATVQNLSLGKKKLRITHEAYKDFERDEVLFIGLNKLNPVSLEGAGIPISFVVKNAITGKPLQGAEVAVGKNKATTGSEGTAIVNVLPTGGVKATAKITKKDFNDSSLKVKVEQNGEIYTIKLTPAGKNYFLSNRSGKIDLYQSNLDGSNQTIILKATGEEDSYTRIDTSPDNRWVAMISTREGVRGPSNDLVEYLYMIDPKTKAFSRISSEMHPSTVGWMGDTLIYQVDNGKYDENRLTKLVSYNATSRKTITLATANYFSSTLATKDFVVYSIADKTSEVYGLFIIKEGGTDKKTLSKESVYQVYSATNNSIVFSSTDTNKWYSYNFNTKQSSNLGGRPASLVSISFVYSPSFGTSAFTQTRDGKNDLYVGDRNGENEKKITNQGSVTYPLRWVGEGYIIFRIADQKETADYIISSQGGEALKIADVYTQPMGYGY